MVCLSAFMHSQQTFIKNMNWLCTVSFCWFCLVTEWYSATLQFHGLELARLLSPRDFPVKPIFFRGSSRPGDRVRVSASAGLFFTPEPPGKPPFPSVTWKIERRALLLRFWANAYARKAPSFLTQLSRLSLPFKLHVGLLSPHRCSSRPLFSRASTLAVLSPPCNLLHARLWTSVLERPRALLRPGEGPRLGPHPTVLMSERLLFTFGPFAHRPAHACGSADRCPSLGCPLSQRCRSS